MLSAIAATLNRATFTLGFNAIMNWNLDAGKSSAGGRGTTSQQP
jgi:hypothetical protein